jgi:predicted phosphodiesterase
MKIQYFSDLHLGHEYHFRNTLTVPEAVAPIAVIAGDIWESGREFKLPIKCSWMEQLADKFEEVIFVAGNHDYYHSDIDKMNEEYTNYAAKISNVHFLNNSHVVIGDVKFLGCTLWTDFLYTNEYYEQHVRLNDLYSLNDSTCIFEDKKLIRPQRILDIHKESVQYLSDNIEEGCVVVTHHGMTYKGLHEKWLPRFPDQKTINHLFFSDLEWLLLEKKPKLVISGHTHDHYDVSVGTTRIVCNPRGYVSSYDSENPDFDWQKVVDI